MSASERFVSACVGLMLCVGALVSTFMFWPLGALLLFFAFGRFAEVFRKASPEMIYHFSEPSASLEFGPSGLPVPEGTPALEIGGKVIYPAAIRAVTFYPASPLGLQDSRKGLPLPIPGDAQGRYSIVRIVSGEELRVCGTEDDSLREWVLHYVPSASPAAAGIRRSSVPER